MSEVSSAIQPLNEAVSAWQCYLEDNDEDHMSMVLELTNALNLCAARLVAENNSTVFRVIDDLVEACQDLARELGEPFPDEAEA